MHYGIGCTADRTGAATWLDLVPDTGVGSPVGRENVALARSAGLASWRRSDTRVSTRSQNDDSQIDDLTAYGCDKIFTDTASGKCTADELTARSPRRSYRCSGLFRQPPAEQHRCGGIQ